MNPASSFERDWIGYGNMQKCPAFAWPEGKQIAVTFVVNFEEGSESSKEVVHEIRETARTEKDTLASPPDYDLSVHRGGVASRGENVDGWSSALASRPFAASREPEGRACRA